MQKKEKIMTEGDVPQDTTVKKKVIWLQITLELWPLSYLCIFNALYPLLMNHNTQKHPTVSTLISVRCQQEIAQQVSNIKTPEYESFSDSTKLQIEAVT